MFLALPIFRQRFAHFQCSRPKIGFRFITFTRAIGLHVDKKHDHVSAGRLCSGKFTALCIIPVLAHYRLH